MGRCLLVSREGASGESLWAGQENSLVVSLRARVEGAARWTTGSAGTGEAQRGGGMAVGCELGRGWRSVTLYVLPPGTPPPCAGRLSGAGPLWGRGLDQLGISVRAVAGLWRGSTCTTGSGGLGAGIEPLCLLEDLIQEQVDPASPSPCFHPVSLGSPSSPTPPTRVTEKPLF